MPSPASAASAHALTVSLAVYRPEEMASGRAGAV